MLLNVFGTDVSLHNYPAMFKTMETPAGFEPATYDFITSRLYH